MAFNTAIPLFQEVLMSLGPCEPWTFEGAVVSYLVVQTILLESTVDLIFLVGCEHRRAIDNIHLVNFWLELVQTRYSILMEHIPVRQYLLGRQTSWQ